MLAINDVMCAKLLIQMGWVKKEPIRELLKTLEQDFDNAFDLTNRLFQSGALDEEQVRRLRSFVALYNYVRSESLYLRVLENEKMVKGELLMRLVALIEAEWYRRRLGDVLMALGKLTVEQDKLITAKVLRQVDNQDRKILQRYKSEAFEGVDRPLIPVSQVNVKSFRLSTIFRGKQTRSFVRKHLEEHSNAANAIERSLSKELNQAKPSEGADFGDVWALPDGFDSDPNIEAPVKTEAPPTQGKRPASILLAPQVRNLPDNFAPTIRFEGPKLLEAANAPAEALIDGYRIINGPEYQGIGQALFRVNKDGGPEHILQSIDPRVAPAKELARFQRQIKVLLKLENDYCLRIVDRGSRSDGSHYMVLPVLEGQTISERIKASGAIPMVEAFDIIDRLLEALDAIHNAGFVYRDMRPENVLLLAGKHAHPVITDFRLTWVAKSSLPASAQAYLTRADELLGHPAYLAPETATNDPVDSRTDLYSLAIMFFEMLTGTLPLRAASPSEYLNQHLIGQPYSLAEARPDIEWIEELEAIIAKMLAKNRKDRPESAQATRGELARLRNKAISAAARAPMTVRHDHRAVVSGIFNEFFKMEL